MDLELKDKVAIISGSTRGIGKGIALMLAEEGCRVVICGRTQETLDQTAREIQDNGGEVLPLLGDITQNEFISKIVDTTLKKYGVIDVLVNNVGGNRRGNFEDTTEEDWQSIIDLNLMSHVRMCQTVLPVMKKQQGGSIIFISSIFGRELGGPTLSIYNTTKAAVNSLSKVMSSEAASDGVRVNTVAPGSIRFPGGSWDKRCLDDPEGMDKFVKDNLPIGRFGTVEEVASVVSFLASPKASLVTGTCINVDGCQSRTLI